MIGVILWRDIDDGKAVIWCEDQGDLAYLDRIEDILDPEITLSVGDVVRFDMTIERNMRLALNVTRLLDNWGSTLGDALRKVPNDPDTLDASTGPQILTFMGRETEHLVQNVSPEIRRIG
ncbi:MAG: hypothetical protein ABJ370_10435 [Paracoccaceae bacterium]